MKQNKIKLDIYKYKLKQEQKMLELIKKLLNILSFKERKKLSFYL